MNEKVRTHKKRWAAGAVTAALIGASFLAGGTSQAAMSAGVSVDKNGATIEATFNDPYVGKKPDYKGADYPGDNTILNDYTRLVDAVPKGGSVRAGIFNASGNAGGAVYTAFSSAKKRGVSVQAVLSKKTATTGPAKNILNLLGNDAHICANEAGGRTNGACLSNAQGDKAGELGGLMHAKFALFSQTKDRKGATRKNVVWISSANFADNAGGARGYNNALTIYDDESLYKQLEQGLWVPMFKGIRPNGTIGEADRGVSDFRGMEVRDATAKKVISTYGTYNSTKSGVTVYVSPDSSTTDLYGGRLNDFLGVTATSADRDETCQVYVQHVRFKKTATAKELKRLAGTGCAVKGLTYKQPAGGSKAEQQSNYFPAAIRKIWNDTANMTIRCAPIHDKTVILKSPTSAKGSTRYFVLAGSHNVTPSAQTRHDEIIVKVESEALFKGYQKHFQAAWGHSDPVSSSCIF